MRCGAMRAVCIFLSIYTSYHGYSPHLTYHAVSQPVKTFLLTVLFVQLQLHLIYIYRGRKI
ncbi:hypothetical protein F4782DRAFT_515778 [Xylaria castorea]|nr:hypothetical protein F4782DRAFT_515778 [Xylaria castorea]